MQTDPLNPRPRLSIIIPFHNEAGNAGPLLRETRQLLPEAEVIAVDDGSTDRTFAEIAEISGVKVLQHPANFGQSAALWSGLRAAEGELLVLLDGDGQNDPRDILPMLAQAGPGRMVCGVRVRRADSAWRIFCGGMANAWRNFFLRDGLSDAGCTLKILPRAILPDLVFFDGFHRFLGALGRAAGLELVEVPVSHRRRLNGRSHYSAHNRLGRGLQDLFGVAWLLTRRRRLREISSAVPASRN